jgi:hypothetical protein
MMRKATDFFHLAKLTQSMMTPSPSNYVFFVQHFEQHKGQLDTIYKRIQQSAELGETKIYMHDVPSPIRDHLIRNGFNLDQSKISWEPPNTAR